MRLKRRKPLPPPPENVHVVYSDGRVVPLECVYLGPDAGGFHMWGAVLVIPLDKGMHVKCDRLPARTGVCVLAERVEL